ncbi:hypothetical protein GGR52DRAFT_571565 [Hypoxylon sp. FL1284]|nr:hypothetical protein GGR52DRAFT_571565 [Hypoxylon sp. FL1284]
MAEETPPGASPVGKFNNAISDFASSYVTEELQKIVRERDDALARSHVPKLRALLREVDHERQMFEQDKEQLIQRLRNQLELLQVDAAMIESTLADLNSMTPKYLSFIPSASTLTIRPPTPSMPPVRDNYFDTVLGAESISDEPPLATTALDRGVVDLPEDRCSSPTNINVSPSIGRATDYQVQSQALSEDSVTIRATKQPRTEGGDSNEIGVKRQKLDSPKVPNRTQPDIFRKVAFPNLITGERIFRHAHRQGYFVIRCSQPRCKTGFFTDPPLAYSRALRHFQGHGETGPDGEELSNEYIFDNFACEVEGTRLVSKYWMKEHLGLSPHTFVPGRSRARTSQADAANGHQRPENDKNHTPSSKPQSTPIFNGKVEELQIEKPRRTPRSVPRPDYAELIANKDPWNLSDMDSDKTTRSSKEPPRKVVNGTDRTSRSLRLASTPSRSRSSSSELSTPALSIIRAKTTESMAKEIGS